jgi:hypothetical protein
VWIRRTGSGPSGNDAPRSMTTDRSGNVYVTGESLGDDGSFDMLTLKYTGDGVPEWQARYSAAPRVDDIPSGIVVDRWGSVIVSGTSSGEGWSMISTVKYAQGPVSPPGPPGSVPPEFGVAGNYPNPFNGSTTLAFDLPSAARVTADLFDLLGRRVAALISSVPYSAGRHTIDISAHDLATGVYLCRIQAVCDVTETGFSSVRFIGSRKMMVVK